MKYYLYIKTIADEKSKIKENIFDSISKGLKIEKLRIIQRFVGKGFALLEKSDNLEKLEKYKAFLSNQHIKSFIISEEEIAQAQQRILYATKVQENSNDYIFSNAKNKVRIPKKDDIVFIGGINNTYFHKLDKKTLVMNNDFKYILYFKNSNIIIVLNHYDINYSGLKNYSKYSKTENLFLFIKKLKENANSYNEDLYYSYNYVPDLSTDITNYSIITALLYNRGYFSFEYNQDLYISDINVKKIKNDYDFHFDIYKPGHIFPKKKSFTVESKLKKLFFPFIVLIFIFAFAVKANYYSMLPYVISGLGIYYIFLFVKALKFKMYIEDIPTSKIESISVGLREVKGSVINRNAIPSPISGVQCVFFRYYKYRKHINKDGKEENRLIEIGEYLPKNFYIQENGHIIEVNTENATFNIRNKNKYRKPYFTLRSVYFEKNVYYIEEILPIYTEIYIMGTASIQDTKKAFSRFLKARKHDYEYMKQFDRNHDNKIDMDEWEEAKLAIEREFEEIQNNKKQSELLQIKYTEDDKLLYISDRSEKDIIRHLNYYVFTALVFGLISFIGFIKLIWG